MIARLRDKIAQVRVWAVATLHRLQDPTDQTDPVILEYLRIMKTDSSKCVMPRRCFFGPYSRV